MKQLTKSEIDALTREILLTFDTTLTETRYNHIMDAILPTLEGFPDAQGTLMAFGQLEWRKRRTERNRKNNKETAA
jgi:hypothetical protein